MNLLRKLWAYEPVFVAVILPALAAFAAGAEQYLSGHTDGGATGGAAGLIAVILGLLVRNKVFAPANVKTAQDVAQNLRDVVAKADALHDRFPSLSGHEGQAQIAPWPVSAPDPSPAAPEVPATV